MTQELTKPINSLSSAKQRSPEEGIDLDEESSFLSQEVQELNQKLNKIDQSMDNLLMSLRDNLLILKLAVQKMQSDSVVV